MAGRQDLQLNVGSKQWGGGGFYTWYCGSVFLVERSVLSCEHIYVCVCVCAHRAEEEPNTEASK
jgi:hypothetical protein